MQQIRIIGVASFETEAEAQAAADAVADVLAPVGGVVETAPWTKDLSAARKAQWAAEQAAVAEAKAIADRTAVDKIVLALADEATLTKEQKAVVTELIANATGIETVEA